MRQSTQCRSRQSYAMKTCTVCGTRSGAQRIGLATPNRPTAMYGRGVTKRLESHHQTADGMSIPFATLACSITTVSGTCCTTAVATATRVSDWLCWKDERYAYCAILWHGSTQKRRRRTDATRRRVDDTWLHRCSECVVARRA